MPRSLIVLRHARAGSLPGGHDSERPLTETGRRDAARVGRELTAIGAVPDLVRCSTARRTRETWSELSRSLGGEPAIDHDSRIYDADVGTLFDVTSETDDAVRAVMIVGHNPAVADFVLSLTGGSDRITGFPPAAFAVVALPDGPEAPDGWRDMAPGSGRLAAFWTPKH